MEPTTETGERQKSRYNVSEDVVTPRGWKPNSR